AELNHQRVLSIAIIPNLLQGAFARSKHGFGEIRLQLAAHMRGILLPGRKLHAHSLSRAEQFKGNRLPAKGEIAKKLCKSLRTYIQLGRQGSSEFRKRLPTKGHRF